MAKAQGVQVRKGKFWGLAGAITQLGRSNDWKSAVDLLQLALEQWEKWDLLSGPDVPAFNAAVNILGRNVMWRNSLAIVDTMAAVGLQPNAMTFGGLLRAEPWARGLLSLDHMARLNVETNVILLNTALADCRSEKHWRFGMNLLSAAAANGLQLDIVSFNSAVVVSGQSNTWGNGLSILQLHTQSKLQSDSITCNSCIQCCAEGSSVNSWKCILSLTHDNGQPNLSGFNAAVSGLSKAKKWQEAGHQQQPVLHEFNAI